MKKTISKNQLRNFGIFIGFSFPIILGYFIPLISGHGFRLWSLWIGITSLIVGLIKPRLLYFPYNFWMLLGHYLGWINSRLILGIVYFLVLIPIAFIMKIFKYDPLNVKLNNSHSYKENKVEYKTDLTKIF